MSLVPVAMPMFVVVSMFVTVPVFVVVRMFSIVRVLMRGFMLMTVLMSMIMLMFVNVTVLMFVFAFFAHGFTIPSNSIDLDEPLSQSAWGKHATFRPLSSRSLDQIIL